MGMRWRARTVLAIVALVVAGCGSSGGGTGTVAASTDPAGGPTADLPVAVDADALSPPGTALGGDVTVQDGSWLVGPVFPLVEPYRSRDGEPVTPHGWQAVLVVDGDPLAVWDAYATALGIGDQADARHACVVQQELTEPLPGSASGSYRASRLLTDPVLDREDRLVCSATIGTVDAHLAVGSTPCVGFGDGDACVPRPTSHLFLRVDDGSADQPFSPFPRLATDDLRYQRAYDEAVGPDGQAPASSDPAAADAGSTGTTASTTIQPPDTQPEPIPIPDGPIVAPALAPSPGPSRLPEAGERVDDHLDDFLGTDDRDEPPSILPAGSRSLVAPTMLLDCNSGLVAVVETPGSAEAASKAFEGGPDQGGPGQHGRDGDRDWAAHQYPSAGGYYLDTVAVGTGDGPSTVLGTECGD